MGLCVSMCDVNCLCIKYPVVYATNLSFASHVLVGLNVLCTCSNLRTVSGYAAIFSILAVDQFVLNVLVTVFFVKQGY